jgi:hypothetical protein
MRRYLLGIALLGGLTAGISARAASPPTEQATVQPVYWNGDHCGPRCQERQRQWRRHEQWEARREWHHRQWQDRRYGYQTYPRY